MTLREALILFHYQKLVEHKSTLDDGCGPGAYLLYEQPEALVGLMFEAISLADYAINQGEVSYKEWMDGK